MSETQEEGLSALLHETRTFPPPEELAKQANAQPGIYAEAESDPLAFWASQAKQLTWDTPWSDVLEWNLPFAKWFVGGKLNVAVNCVDRHVAAGLGARVAFHWEGEPGDTRTITYDDLLDHGEPGRQRADRARGAGGGQGGHLHADDPRDGRGHAGLCPARRAPHGGLRRLLGRRADAAASSTATPTSSSPPTAATAGAPRARSSRRSTRRCRNAPRSRHVLVVRRTGQEVAWDEGRDVWWHDLVPRQPETHEARGLRRRAPALHHVHLAARRPSPRASSTRAAATSPTSRPPTASSSTSSPRPTCSGPRPTSAG